LLTIRCCAIEIALLAIKYNPTPAGREMNITVIMIGIIHNIILACDGSMLGVVESFCCSHIVPPIRSGIT